jgi:hypothetical protein
MQPTGVHNASAKKQASRWRPLPWVIGGAGVAALCLGLGTVASRHWSKPEPGVIPSTGLAALNDPPEPQEPPPVEASPPSVEDPSAPFIPWAWLDQPARPEPPSANAPAPPPTALDANELASRAGPDLDEPVSRAPASDTIARDTIASEEVQRVAGTDSADAGAAAATENSAATLAQLGSEAPDTAPEDPEPIPPGVACGFVTCAPGYDCCNPSCGVCVQPGDNCDPAPCESRIQTPESDVCGRSTCSKGQFCCNPSCGTCVEPGESCDQTPCDNAIQYPFSPICGRATCSVGKVCCNPSCGICVAPGESCSQQPCDML